MQCGLLGADNLLRWRPSAVVCRGSLESCLEMPSLVLTPWRAAFLNRVKLAKNSVLLVSPFMKFNVVSTIYRELASKEISVRTITRCRTMDFAAGASDIDAVYALSGLDRPDGRMQLRIDNRLHAKIFILDEEVAFVGSSNLTFSGLQTNYEAVVQTDNCNFVRALVEETSRCWNSAKPVSDTMLSEALAQLKMFVRTSPIQRDREEHYYEAPERTDVVVEPTAEQEAFASEAIKTAAEQFENEPAFEAAPRLTGRDEPQELGLRDAVDCFLETVRSRFGVALPTDDLGLPAAGFILDFGSYTRAFDTAHEDALSGHPVSQDEFTSLKEIGHAVWNLGLAMICVRSGILRRFGPAGATSFCAAAGGRHLLDSLWDQNLLGTPWVVNMMAKDAKARACYRMLGMIAVEQGIEAAADVVEEFFNPTDLLGDDLVNVIDLKHSKMLLQEAVQGRGRSLSYGGYEHEGSAHEPVWRSVLRIGGVPEFRAEGKTKGEAETETAKAAIRWMWSDPAWRAILIDLRQRAADLVKRSGPWRVAPDMPSAGIVAEVGARFRADTGLDLPDTVVFPAFVDRKVRSEMRLGFDNQALAFIGAAIINGSVSMNSFRNGRSIPDSLRQVWARLHEVLQVDGTWNLIPVERDYTDRIGHREPAPN
jgi:PLD-like domain